MAGTVHLPLVGETNKATLVIAGVAGTAALGWALWKDKKSKQAASTATATSATASSAANGYGYGALTYQPYGYGFGSSGLGEYGYGESSGGDYENGYYGAGTAVNEEVPGQAANNAEWSEAAMTALTSAGWSGSDVLTALGLYITGSPVSANQQGIIQAAIAAEGYPPSPGANGYPPAIHTGPATGQTGTGTGMVTVPDVAGQTADAALATLKTANLKGTIILDPASKKKGTYHIVTKTSPAAGASVKTGSSVVLYYRDSKTA